MKTKSRTLSVITKQAILKYGYETCRQAFISHKEGNGANTISHEFSSLGGNTRKGDSAINAGREISELAAK